MFKKMLVAVIILAAFVAAVMIFLPGPRTMQAEAWKNLESIRASEEAYRSAHGCYAARFDQLNWKPRKRLVRYAFHLSRKEFMKGYKAADIALPPDVNPYVLKDTFLIVANGNIDKDPVEDIWTIDEKDVLKNEFDDVKNLDK